MKPCTIDANRTGECGATFVLVAFFLLFLLGAAALAIDLGMLYVTRSEAQRTADAAALAAANTFSSCAPSATCESAGAEAIATTAALQSAQANPVLGLSPTGTCTSAGSGNSQTQQACMAVAFSDPTLASSNPGTEPQATVTIQRTGIQLIFARMFNQRIGQVSAVATAEYYQGNGVAACVTPFLVPNCDPNPNNAETPNSNCAGGTYGGFVNATITGTAPYYTVTSTIANPEIYDPTTPGTAGVLGEPWTLHYAYPNSNGTIGQSGSVTPSQWSVAAFTSNSAEAVAQEIAQCPPVNIACGSLVNTKQGDTPEKIDEAVNSLIHHNPCTGNSSGSTGCGSQDGPGTGQDYLSPAGGTSTQPYPTSFNTTCPMPNIFSFDVGSWNTHAQGNNECANLGASASIIQAPIYQGNNLTAGMNAVIVVGYAELFIDYSQFVSVPGVGAEETVQANVINIQNCGSGGPGSTVAASPIPIRLIQGPN